MYVDLHVKYLLFLSDFLHRFSRSTDLLEILSMRAELFGVRGGGQRYGQADMTKLIVVFRSYAHAPTNGSISLTFVSEMK